MPRYTPVAPSTLSGASWRRFANYDFAATDAVAPLVVQELATAFRALPIGFIAADGAYTPVAVQGLEPGQNLFVVNGTWVAPYSPAAYRGYPFALAEGEGDVLHLCVDMDSGLVGEGDGFDQPFFDETGEAAPGIKDVLNFLEQVHRNRAATQRICAALAAEGLIQPWPLTVQGPDGARAIEGLHRIDEARLNALDADALHRVHAAGALPVAYCQLLSMSNIQTLGLIARKLQEMRVSAPDAGTEVDLDGFFRRNTADLGVPGPGDGAASVIDLSFDDGDIDLTRLSRN